MRPGGPGWKRQRARTGIAPAQDLGRDIQRVIAGLFILFGLMFSVGGILLLRWGTAITLAAIAAVGYVWLRSLGKHEEAPLLPEPATHP